MNTLLNPPYEEVPKISNFDELLSFAAINNPLKPAFTYNRDDQKHAISFSEFRQNARIQANLLAKKYKRTHIALIGENSIEWLTLFFAIVLSNNVVVVIDKEETPEKIEAMLKTAKASVIFYSEKYKPEVKIKKLKLIPFSEVYNVSPVENIKLPDTKPADLSMIFFTSGTNGPNKAVMLSQKNVCTDIYAASSLYRPYGTTVSFLPFHHAFGLVTAVLMPFYYGCTTFLTSSLKNVAKDIKENKPFMVFVVPAVIELFYRQIWREARKTGKTKMLRGASMINGNLQRFGLDFNKFLFKSVHQAFGGELKNIICGGAYLDPKYVKWFRSIGVEVLNGYGITECSPVLSVNRVKYHKDGSVGQICRDVEIKIADDEEILVKSDIVMQGYYGDRKATKNAIDKEGYFHTGDLGYIDRNGFLFITGRKKNLIILSNGENVSPETIESELLHDEATRECIVYAEDNQIIAEIYPTDDFMGDQEYFDELLYNYNKNKSRNHQVAMIRLRTEEFKKNNNTKILRNKVKE